jgi:hypothetical protein
MWISTAALSGLLLACGGGGGGGGGDEGASEGEADSTPEGGDGESSEVDSGAESTTEDPDSGEGTDSGNPEGGEPDTDNPEGGEPDTAKPDTAEPDTTEPDTAEPEEGGDSEDGGEDTGCACANAADCDLEAQACETVVCVDCACKVEAKTNGSACDDGNACTEGDTCTNGACNGGDAVDCDDGNACTVDACAPATGCTNTNAAAGACDDGNACTTGDACNNGACSGAAVVCNDGNPCTADSCDPAMGCSWLNASGLACDDGDACTEDDICTNGVCGGSPVDCNDGNVCTTDACLPGGVCSHIPAPLSCDDGNPCNQGDVCNNGACKSGTQPADCDDGNPCTTDSCLANVGCTHTPNASACSDGLVCNGPETCANGQCPSGAACACISDAQCPDDGNLCNGTAFCDLEKGTCALTPSVVCDSQGDACETYACVPATGQCAFSAKANGIPCDDGNACTVKDGCLEGGCVGTPVVCTDDNPCATSQCDPASGCKLLPTNGVACDDGNACTDGDKCSGLGCAPGELVCPADYCCFPKETPGCEVDAAAQSCTCEEDSFCCDVTWDEICVGVAVSACALDCPEASNFCCIGSGIAGCPFAPGIEECVCDLDPLCCTESWDGQCAQLAQKECGLTCTGPCCDETASGGCADDENCESCVCDADPLCCSAGWDSVCVELAESTCFLQCGCAPQPGTGDCCKTDDTPGCEDLDCQTCVCNSDAVCCDVAWDSACVACAAGLYCETPGQPSGCGETCACENNGGDCCSAHPSTGCELPGCEDCVCTLDPFCCEVEWDSSCTEVAALNCAGDCECGPAPAGSCCAPSGGPGCENDTCSDCVCATKPACCAGEWGPECVQAAVACGDDCPCITTDATTDCCSTSPDAGCERKECEACVCDDDALCCSAAWDALCAQATFGTCSELCLCELPSCCEPSDFTSCDDPVCQACVCAADDFCCDIGWDEFCVDCAQGDPCGLSGANCGGACSCP